MEKTASLRKKDARGVVTQYRYDDNGKPSERNSPDSGVARFSYDEAGNLTKRVDARDVLTIYSYDALNRIIKRQYPLTPSYDTTFIYDDQSQGKKQGGFTLLEMLVCLSLLSILMLLTFSSVSIAKRNM